MSEESMKRISLEEIGKLKSEGRLYKSDKLSAGEDLGPDFWDKALVVEPRAPKSVHLKVDPEVFDFFKAKGKGHITRMQEVLRAYVRAHQK